MYQLGDLVVYSSHGVCRVADMEQRIVDKKTVSYYVLCPLDSEKTKYYIPAHNPAAMSKLRNLITREELVRILQDPGIHEDCWIPEENRRKLRYKELSGSGDFFAMVQMVCSLQAHQRQQIAAGRKFHMVDENFLREAQKTLESELSIVLQVAVSAVKETVEQLLHT